MGSTTDKIKGTANEAMGKAKQGIGEATDNERLEGEGAMQELKGKGQKTVGDAKEAAKDAMNRAAAAANKKGHSIQGWARRSTMEKGGLKAALCSISKIRDANADLMGSGCQGGASAWAGRHRRKSNSDRTLWKSAAWIAPSWCATTVCLDRR